MELEGRRRWLGLLAATLALPGCVSMGPRPEPGRPCRRTGPGRGGRADGGAAALVDGLRGQLDALAERALAGNLTLAQAAQRLKRRAPCRVASPPPRTRRARPAPPKPTCARPGCRWPPRPCAPISNCAARSGAIRCCPASGASGLLDDQQPSARLVQGARRRAGIASDFDVDRASVLEAETAAQLPLSAQLARQHAQRLAVLTGESQIAPGLLASAGQPCRAASRPRRCRPISCASGRTSVARNSRCCRPRPNYGVDRRAIPAPDPVR